MNKLRFRIEVNKFRSIINAYRKQSIDLHQKSIYWFLCDRSSHRRCSANDCFYVIRTLTLNRLREYTQLAFTCSESTTEGLEKGVKYVQS